MLLGLSAVIVIIVIAILFWPRPFISDKIKNEVTSPIFVPSGQQVQNKKATVKFDDKLKLLSFQSTIYSVNFTISEQPTPESFTDIPQVYQKVLASWKQYGQFDTAVGTVYLTRPGNQNGRQVGVLNAKGTLTFVKADKDLSDDQWRQTFNNLDIVK